MIHGYVKGETFAGRTLHPGARFVTGKIGLSITSAYLFIGYRTSILRHMIDTRDHTVSGTAQHGFTVHVKIAEVMKSGEQQIIDSFRGAALGVAGGFVSAVDAMNNVLDAISVGGYVGDMLPGGDAPPKLVRPSKGAYAKDHLLGNRIMVRLESNKGSKPGWIDTRETEMPLEAVARLVAAA